MDLASPAVSGTSVYANGLTKEFVHTESLYSSEQSKTSLHWTATKSVCMVRLGETFDGSITFDNKLYQTVWITVN